MVYDEGMQTILSPNRTIVGTPARSIDVIVVHDMEYPERPTGAEWCANYFARRWQDGGPKASAHYMVDNDSVVRGVPDKDVAWAAPGNNHNGIQIEYAGYARQTAAEWNDDYSKAALALGAKLTALLCKTHNIPVVYLTATDLRAGKRGITTHDQVSKAWGRSNHTDPGPNFPMAAHIAAIRAERVKLDPPKTITVFQVVNNGKLIYESDTAIAGNAPSERLRLKSFLDNHIRGIHAQLTADPDASLQLKLVRKVEKL